MHTVKEIKAEIKELQGYMKENGIRKTSFMNGGLDRETYRCNARLFALKTELQRAERETKDNKLSNPGWVPAKAIRIRKVKGQTVIDVKQ